MITFLTNEDERRYVKTVNGIIPDENGNIVMESTEEIGASNWNSAAGEIGHIIGRTHWADWEDGEVIFNYTFTSSTISDYYNVAPIKANSYYKVTYNGEEYIALTYTNVNNFGYVFCGSKEVQTGTGKGEYPFFIANGNGDLSYTYGLSYPCTIQVQEVFPAFHKLAKEYLPDEAMTLPNWNSLFTQPGCILNKTHYREEVNPYYDYSLNEQTVPFEGLEYVQISTYTPSIDRTVGSTIKMTLIGYQYDTELYPGVDDCEIKTLPYNAGYSISLNSIPIIIVLFEDGDYKGQTYLKGTYFMSANVGIHLRYWSALDNVEPVIKYLDSEYIKDMYYSEFSPINDILNNTELSYNSDLDAYYYPILSHYPEKDKIYQIIYNNKKYQLTAQEHTLDGVTALLFGNPSALELGYSNGIPFTIICGPAIRTEFGVDLFVLPLDAAESVTISLSEAEEKVHLIDKKYLPIKDIQPSSCVISLSPSTTQSDTFILTINDNDTIQTYSMRLMHSTTKTESGSNYAINQVTNQYRFECVDDSLTLMELQNILNKFIDADYSKFIFKYYDSCISNSLSYSDDNNYPGLYINGGHVFIRLQPKTSGAAEPMSE